MPLLTIAPPAGLFHNGTVYQSAGRWFDMNLMRFQQDEVKPVGGWQLRSSSAAAFAGSCRALLSWRDNSNNRWIAVSSHSHLYVQTESGANFDITPIRRTVTLAANSLATTNLQKAVVVTDNAHGANVGDTVLISGATGVGGIPAGDLNGFKTVTAATTNTWTFLAADAATSTATGGGTPTLQYEIAPGRPDATQNLGYGGGTYGTGDYGVPRPNTSSYLPATVWSLDAWGEDLAGCADSDGKVYLWSLSTGTPAALVSGAPTGCASVLVTAEGFLLALGASGDGRRVAWCDQQNITVWTPLATNQAGDYDLTTVGTLQCGKALPSGALLLTDTDAWLASYIGAPLVYGFERVGSGCGIVAKGAIAAQDARAVWMGKGGSFWIFDGQSVQPLDCDVLGKAADINQNQISKVTAVHLAEQGEVWFFYPSAAATEIDSYIGWCYRESYRLGRNIWVFGALQRLCGTGRGVFPNPLMVDGSGMLWEHETGWYYAGAQPFIESGPFEIAQGEFMAEVQLIIPDQKGDGNSSLSFFTRAWPDGPETQFGPYSTTSPTNVLFQATQLRMRFTAAVNADWRVGKTRLSVVRGDPADYGMIDLGSGGGGYDFSTADNSTYL